MLKLQVKMRRIPIVTVVGYSNAGKTRCTTGLIAALTRRGYRVASAKHCHDDFQLDVEGKDSWQHKQAGAVTTIMSNRHQLGAVVTPAHPLTLEQICEQYIHDADILLAEGYSSEPFPKILVTSQETIERERVLPNDLLIAQVGERLFDLPIPQFSFHEVEELASLLEQNYLRLQLASIVEVTQNKKAEASTIDRTQEAM